MEKIQIFSSELGDDEAARERARETAERTGREVVVTDELGRELFRVQPNTATSPPQSRGAEVPDASPIRAVCSRFGVSPRTLRFYEQRGLVTPTRVGRVRHFGAEDLERLERVFALKKLGMTLAEIELTLKVPAEGPLGLSRSLCERLIVRLRERKQAVDAALMALEGLAAHSA
jgi:DNA-binding transcriptional MerR regulator